MVGGPKEPESAPARGGDPEILTDVFRQLPLFELNLSTLHWKGTPKVAFLFGLDPATASESFSDWERLIVDEDVVKLRAAIGAAQSPREFGFDFRVRRGQDIRWLSLSGIIEQQADSAAIFRGTCADITDKKTIETEFEKKISDLQEEAHILDVVNRAGVAIAAERGLEQLVQLVTDAGVEMSGAQFGAFFYNVINNNGESYTLYTLSGAPRSAFERFPMPRNTAVFEPTFRGTGTIRSDDILADLRYGHSAPYHGMPQGHLPVRSYLAVPVMSRSGEVLGGLFFGHSQPCIFTARAERAVSAIAAQAAVAIDNARLHQANDRELDARRGAERELQELNEALEARASERSLQLATSKARLEETEHRFQLLVEAVTDYAIYMLDVDGNVVNWNPGAERIKGYAPGEIIGQHFSRFYTESEQRNGVPQRALLTAAATGKYEAEGLRVRKDGSTFWASATLNAIHDSNGTLVGFTKITRDLTERKSTEERLRQAQKMEAVGQLTGGVAHDFNNLLTIIMGNLETLQRRMPEKADERIGRFAEAALMGVDRAAVLVRKLLAFSRRQTLEPKPVSVDNLIAGMSDMLKRTLGETIIVETSIAEDLWPTFVDVNQLESALLNLAINSRDAMPTGGKLTIEAANVFLNRNYADIAEIPSGQYVGLFVTDSGIGMTPEVVSQAFDPFFTTKEVGQGTGLGLSQVYGFIKQSGGHIKIYSEVGEGTTVKLYLPRYLPSEGSAETKTKERGIPRAKGETILVVEDDAIVRSLSVDTLSELGYRVIGAPDAATALQILDGSREIALLFTDVVLPKGMNGKQLADEAQNRRPALKVLFTSGYPRNAIVHQGRLDPGVELLAKPFTYAALAEQVRRILDEP
jgi:PAS domain S-box-containing protein